MTRMAMKTIPALLLAAFSSASFAAGFAIQAQNGSGNGNAFAGASAVAEDAGTIFFNPAGMTYLPQGHNISVAATYLKRSIEFTDKGTSGLLGSTGTNGGDAGGSSVIPALYWSMALSPVVRIGLGVSPTFGNVTEYDETFYGRYSGYYADLKQININPSIAFKASDEVSVGFGWNFAKNETEFRQKVRAGAADSDVRLKGDDRAQGYNFGILWQVSKATRVGFHYRESMEFKLKGTQTASIPVSLPHPVLPVTVPVLPASIGVSARLVTPDSVSLALSQKIGERIEVLADVTRTGWSDINAITVTRADGIAHPGLTYNFKDSNRVGLGVNYQMNDQWKLRAGVALDKTPVRSAADTTMTLPDSDRTWLAFGAKFALSKANSIDVGYAHIFFKEARTERAVFVVNPATLGSVQGQTIRGTFDTSADYLSVQYNHNF